MGGCALRLFDCVLPACESVDGRGEVVENNVVGQ